MKKRDSVTPIGLIYTVISFLGTWTMIIPALILLLSMFIELTIKKIIERKEYSFIGNGAIVVLLSMLLILLVFYFMRIIKQQKKKMIERKERVPFFILLLFIIFPTYFWSNPSRIWGSAGDRQFIVEIRKTFPVRNLFFFVIGFFVSIATNIFRCKSMNESVLKSVRA